MIKTSEKISRQMAAANKMAETIKLSETLSKVLNASTPIGLSHKQCLSYISNPSIKWATSEDIKFYDWSKPIDYEAYFKAQSESIFYGGGDFEPLGSKPFWHELAVTNNSSSHFYEYGALGLQPTLDLIKTENSASQLAILSTLKDVSARSIKDSLKSRNEVAEKILDAFFSIEDKYGFKTYDYQRELDRFFNSYHDDLHDLLFYDARINFELSKIQILNKIYKSIKIGLKKISLNKREIFRKMNSFLFKNLDDYHSLAY
jgi:hypothetical protein